VKQIDVEEATRDRAAELFAAMAHPIRLRIVEELCKRPLSVGEVAAQMKIGLSGASQHLSLLARAGILVSESKGTSRVYRVRGPRIPSILSLIFEFCHVHQLYGEPTDVESPEVV
jgi:DNA-binding transcriptional ArsR family regulator